MNHLREQWRERIGATGGTVYRGMGSRYTPQVCKEFYTALARDLRDAAQILLDAIQNYEGYITTIWHPRQGIIGVHWTTDIDSARRFAHSSGSGGLAEIVVKHGVGTEIPVILEATYQKEDVITDPKILEEWSVQGYGYASSYTEAEVTLRPGAPITIQALHLAVPNDVEYAALIVEDAEITGGRILPFTWQRARLGVRVTAGER